MAIEIKNSEKYMKKFTFENKIDFLDKILNRCERLSVIYGDTVGCSINCDDLVAAIRKDLKVIDIINNFEKYKGN